LLGKLQPGKSVLHFFSKIRGLVVLWNGNWQIMFKLQILKTNNSVVLRSCKLLLLLYNYVNKLFLMVVKQAENLSYMNFDNN
jgi:hypothetical protein